MTARDINLKTIFLSFVLFISFFGSIGMSEAHILIIGDSANDFPTTYQETSQLAADLRQKGYPVLDFYGDDATTENILKGMYCADVVIYAGHGGYQYGHYDQSGGIATAPFALVGSDDFIWGRGGQMQEGLYGDLCTAPFKRGIPVFLLHTCFSTGWVDDYQVANPIETIYNFAQMFNGAGANYYATAWNDAEIIYDFLNGANNFQDANNQNYEKIVTPNLFNDVQVWRNNNGHAAFVGDWSGKFPSVGQTTPYDESAADAWYHGDRKITSNLYVDTNLGNDSWDGTSNTFIGGTTGPMKTITTTLNCISFSGTIHVAPGIYNENLVINQKINLIGSGVGTIITPSNAQNPIINITSGGNSSIITGFILKSASTSSAVAITEASNCSINNNNITGNQIGVLIHGNNNNVVSNDISGNRDGVYCEEGTNQNINNNTITQGSSGVTVKNSKKVKIEDNQIKNNTETGVFLENSNNSTIKRNNISGNQDGIEINGNSQYNTITDNIINNNEKGVSIQQSHNNTLKNNTIRNNTQTGIKLNQSRANSITNLNIVSGSYVGIDIQNNSNQNKITGNSISTNNVLINISNSSGNTINDNNIKIMSSDPVNSAVNVARNKVIIITFTEPIKAGNMWIELKPVIGITIPLTTTINGNILITNYKGLLEAGTQYNLILHTGSITDNADNPIALCGLSFNTTTDSTKPKIYFGDPLNNAVDVARDKVIKLTFNEPIKAGTPWIELKNSIGTIIPLTTSINGNILTINHTILLTAGTQYNLILHTGSVTDLAGNPLALVSRTFNTTTDTAPPTINYGDPLKNAVNVALNKVIKLTFNEPIKSGTMWIELKTTTGTTMPITTTINGNVLTINHIALLAAGTLYNLILHSGSITDISGNLLALVSRSFTSGST